MCHLQAAQEQLTPPRSVELFAARRTGLRQERIRGKSGAIMLAHRFMINVRF
jgi:hypothetical protein